MTRIVADPSGKSSSGPFSPAVRIDRVVFTTGQVGVDPATGRVVGDDCGSQTRQALINLKRVLNDLGAGLEDVVRCGVFLTTFDDFEAMNAEYVKVFDEPYPARTTVAVGLPAGLRVELDACVVLPD